MVHLRPPELGDEAGGRGALDLLHVVVELPGGLAAPVVLMARLLFQLHLGRVTNQPPGAATTGGRIGSLELGQKTTITKKNLSVIPL